MKTWTKATALTLALALAACSNDSNEDTKEGEAPATEAPAGAVSPDEAYLVENKAKDGVQVTESGLQYRIITEGTGATPTKDDFVEVHYAGRLVDGTQFDSSYDRGEPNIFPAGRLIQGWTEALTMMKEGAKWELVIPADIGYGPRGAGGVIPPNATLVFDVELISISTAEEAKAREQAARDRFIAEMKEGSAKFLEENATKEGVVVTDSGLQYKVITEGTGKTPSAESTVTVHYAGRLVDGTEFDSSYSRGQPLSFAVNGVISGWTEGLQLMKEGAKYELYIPYTLGYGERGSPRVPPYAAMVFDVELISVDD